MIRRFRNAVLPERRAQCMPGERRSTYSPLGKGLPEPSAPGFALHACVTRWAQQTFAE